MWKYESHNTAEYLSLHDCDCIHIYGNGNNLILEMEWMEVLPEHPNNPYEKAHQSTNGIVEFFDCSDVLIEVNGEDIANDSHLDYKDYEIIEYLIEKLDKCYHAKMYMIKSEPFMDIAIDLIFKSSITRFNELKDVSWFADKC